MNKNHKIKIIRTSEKGNPQWSSSSTPVIPRERIYSLWKQLILTNYFFVRLVSFVKQYLNEGNMRPYRRGLTAEEVLQKMAAIILGVRLQCVPTNVKINCSHGHVIIFIHKDFFLSILNRHKHWRSQSQSPLLDPAERQRIRHWKQPVLLIRGDRWPEKQYTIQVNSSSQIFKMRTLWIKKP